MEGSRASRVRRCGWRTVLGLAASLGLAACGSTGSAAPLARSRILRVDAAARTVQLHLEGSEDGAYGGFNFDGFGGGSMTVRIPVGWTVDVTCTNDSTAFTHSCAVIDDERISPSAAPVAFGASSPEPTTGLAFGASADFTFVPTRVGRYRIACLVTGHEADGMWDWLVVTSGGTPSVRT